jgi:hypothetical protein
MKSLQRYTCNATIIGLCLAATSGAYAQVSSINSAYIDPNSNFQPPIPGSVFTSSSSGNPQNDTLGVTLNEANVGDPGGNGYANQNLWFFSNNGGLSAYNFQNNDYFNATMSFTLTGGMTGLDIEGGLFFNNPNTDLGYGGNLQIFVVGNGVIFQGGGPSYYPFSPAAGGYPGAGGGVPNYVIGQTVTLGLNYVVDPNTGMNSFEYSVNGQFAASSPGDPYFDISPVNNPFGAGDNLGGYFQIQTTGNVNNPNAGSAIFGDISITSVPEPSTLAFLGLGIGALLLRRRHI